jgi:hypothetical protein
MKIKKFDELIEESISNNICVRTSEEIDAEIKRICEDRDNFTTDNYGSEAADNGNFEVNYSEYMTENTMKNFVIWLFKK